jgi:TPR repeat protein
LPRTVPITAPVRHASASWWAHSCLVALLLLVPTLLSADPPAKSIKVVNAEALERRALDAYLGRGSAVDFAAAARDFEVAARAGRPFAQFMLAQQLFNGLGVTTDHKRAFTLYRSAAEQGLATAQSALGWMYMEGAGGTRQNLAAALQWLSSAARQEDARAYLLLSLLYENGWGISADRAFARHLLTRSTELGDPEACLRLGIALLYGPQQQRDPQHGLLVLRKAAGMQDSAANAAFQLGWWYLSAPSRARELPAAAHWMAQSAAAEHRLALLWLSEMHGKGLGLPQNPAKSRQLREQALAKASLRDKNEFAWQLSVSSDELLRNGPLAVRVMQGALTTLSTRNASYLDTLAAAHAESGNFEAAVLTQQDALQVLAGTRHTREKAESMRQRLQSYRDGQAYREAQP